MGEFNETRMGDLAVHALGRRARLKPLDRDGEGGGSRRQKGGYKNGP
jgi:hypothetical protein